MFFLSTTSSGISYELPELPPDALGMAACVVTRTAIVLHPAVRDVQQSRRTAGCTQHFQQNTRPVGDGKRTHTRTHTNVVKNTETS